MGIFEEIQNLAGQVEKLASEHPDQVKAALAKAEEVADDKTGHKYTSQIHAGATKAEGYLGADETPAAPAAPPSADTPPVADSPAAADPSAAGTPASADPGAADPAAQTPAT